METKEIKITPPEGYEIDAKNSTFEHIKFKPKNLTYESICEKLFPNGHYYITGTGIIHSLFPTAGSSNAATSRKQLQKLLALNQLMNVAKYLNDGWQPDWTNSKELKYYLLAMGEECLICVANRYNDGLVYFKSKELALQAIDILGKETIYLALSTDW